MIGEIMDIIDVGTWSTFTVPSPFNNGRVVVVKGQGFTLLDFTVEARPFVGFAQFSVAAQYTAAVTIATTSAPEASQGTRWTG